MDSVESTSSSSQGVTSAVAGAAAGAVAYVVGYLVTYLWQSGSVEESLQAYNAIVDLLGGDPIPGWQAVGWLYYNAHNVAFTTPALGSGRVSQNLVADGNAPMLLYLVPVVVLLAAGFVVARAGDASDAEGGVRAGAAVTLGYAVLAVVGLFLFRYSVGDTTVHVDYALGVLLAGVVYPAVFGGLGGVLGAVTR
ncbi:transporter [Halobacterium rubrum]|uniref:transporter n=1 Tax=Halobacterium TaxID=2239 RepID=UPI001F373924|nr:MULTISPECIES: transporter [Halobacterium]MDH5019620.1 transporter [Halobacterium rubrum]